MLERLPAVQDLHKRWLASLQQHLDSLNIQMEGTQQLLEAAAAVETASDRQQMLKVPFGSIIKLRHLVSFMISSLLDVALLGSCCSSAVWLAIISHGSACVLAVRCRSLP